MIKQRADGVLISRGSPTDQVKEHLMVKFHSAADRYRQDAVRFRRRAATISDDRLRDSYLGLAQEYERLAELLDPADYKPVQEAEPAGRFAQMFRLGKLLTPIVRALLGDRRGYSAPAGPQ